MSEVDYNVEQIVKGSLLARHAIYLMRRGAEAVQQERGLAVDGRAGPDTRAAIEALIGPAPAPAPAVLPRGKGMFIRGLAQTGTRAQALKQMKDRGLTWVAIQRIWQYDDPPGRKSTLYNTSALLEYADDLNAAGFEVWLWGFPVPDKHVEFVDELVASAAKVRARGVILDPEKPFLAAPGAPLGKRQDQARALMTYLAGEVEKQKLGVGVTSYGAPWNFPNFPWREFAEGAGFGMPQLYDADGNMGPNYPKDGVAAWRAQGFARIVPISAAFNRDGAGMGKLLASTPVEGALAWWDWYNCSQAAGRWDAVQAYELGA